MLNRPIHYSQAVTVVLPSGVGAKVDFDEQPRLEGAYILGIEAYTSTQQLTDDQGRALIPAGEANQPLVTFKVNSEERIQQVPYLSLVAATNAGAVNQYAGMTINWPKCFVQIPPGSTFAALPLILYFIVHYIPVDQLDTFSKEELRSFKF